MKFESLEIDSTGGVATIWLNRPDVRNAFDDTVIAELDAALAACGTPDATTTVAAAATTFTRERDGSDTATSTNSFARGPD